MHSRIPKKEFIEAVKKFGLSGPSLMWDTHCLPPMMAFHINRDLTYDDLDKLADLLGTRNISITKCEQGYYGDFESSEVIARDIPNVDSLYLSKEVSEEAHRVQQERDTLDRRARLTLEAARMGLTVVDKSKVKT